MASIKQKIIITATNKTKAAFKAIESGIKKVIGAVFSLKTAFALAAGAAGLGLLIKASLKATDNIGKMSKIYGIATKDLATFNLAAQIGGTTLEQFAKAARNVAKNVFEFVTKGTGEALDAFKALGITAKDLQPIMNDQVAIFNLFGDALKKLPDGLAKTAIAYDLFGGRAIALLPAIADGTEGFNKFRKEVELFGTALDPHLVKAVEQLNDDTLRLKFVFQGFRDQITAQLAPAMNVLINGMRNFILTQAQAKGGVEVLSKTIAFNLIKQIESAAIGTVHFINTVKELSVSIQNSTKYLLENSVILGSIAWVVRTAAEGYKLFFEMISENAGKVEGALKADLISIEKLMGVFSKLRRSFFEIKTEVEEIAFLNAEAFGSKAAADVTRYWEAHSKNLVTTTEQWRSLESDVKDFTEELAKAEEEAEKLKEEGQELGFIFTSAFEDAVISGNSFRDVLQGMFEDIQRIFLRKTITEPFGNFFSEVLGGLFGGGGAGAGAGGTGGIGYGLQKGTDFVEQTGFKFLHKGEAVIPASQNRSGSASIINTFHIDARGADAGVETRIRAGIEQSIKQSQEKLLYDLAHNGPVSRNLR